MKTLADYVEKNSNYRIWEYGAPYSMQGIRILAIIGVWSHFDLNFLQWLKDALERGLLKHASIDLFDGLAESPSMQDLIPGLGGADTPIVGVWEDGMFREFTSGCRRSQQLIEKYLAV